MILALLLAACEREEVRQWRCIGPIVEIYGWRQELSGDPSAPTGAALAAEEDRRVEEAVAKLEPHRRACELTWSFQDFGGDGESPPAALRSRVLRRVLRRPDPPR